MEWSCCSGQSLVTINFIDLLASLMSIFRAESSFSTLSIQNVLIFFFFFHANYKILIFEYEFKLKANCQWMHGNTAFKI